VRTPLLYQGFSEGLLEYVAARMIECGPSLKDRREHVGRGARVSLRQQELCAHERPESVERLSIVGVLPQRGPLPEYSLRVLEASLRNKRAHQVEIDLVVLAERGPEAPSRF
jgi:hypothetical protein